MALATPSATHPGRIEITKPERQSWIQSTDRFLRHFRIRCRKCLLCSALLGDEIVGGAGESIPTDAFRMNLRIGKTLPVASGQGQGYG